jgi:hypothetical protein
MHRSAPHLVRAYAPECVEVEICEVGISTSSPTQQPRLALPGERVGQLIVCWHEASQVEVFTLEREARTDKFTEVEDRYAGYTVYDQHYEKIGNRS